MLFPYQLLSAARLSVTLTPQIPLCPAMSSSVSQSHTVPTPLSVVSASASAMGLYPANPGPTVDTPPATPVPVGYREATSQTPGPAISPAPAPLSVPLSTQAGSDPGPVSSHHLYRQPSVGIRPPLPPSMPPPLPSPIPIHYPPPPVTTPQPPLTNR